MHQGREPPAKPFGFPNALERLFGIGVDPKGAVVLVEIAQSVVEVMYIGRGRVQPFCPCWWHDVSGVTAEETVCPSASVRSQKTAGGAIDFSMLGPVTSLAA